MIAADFPVYVFTETGLDETIASNQVFPVNFAVFRCDRTINTSKKSSKGGVLIAVDKRLNSTLLASCEENGCEQIWVKITGKNLKLVVASIYIPPSVPLEIYSAHMECIKRICNTIRGRTDVMIYGDFNLPNLKWKLDDLTNSMVPVNITSSIESEVIQSCHESGMYQINDILNENSHMLDTSMDK